MLHIPSQSDLLELQSILNASDIKFWGWLDSSSLSPRHFVLQWPGDIKDPIQEDPNEDTSLDQI